MAASRSAATPLVFRGSPRRMKLLGALPNTGELDFKPDKSLAPHLRATHRPLRQRCDRAGKLRKLRVKLDANTPPGRYQARVEVGGKSLPVELHVEERSRLTVAPSGLKLEGKSGGKAKASALFTNRGNTAIEIPRTEAIGIYDDKGLETAFASTYRLASDDVFEQLSHFLGKLRAGHGGLLKFRLTSGYGALQPGESVTVEIEAQLPARLKAGHHYHGVWRVASVNYAVKLAVKK